MQGIYRSASRLLDALRFELTVPFDFSSVTPSQARILGVLLLLVNIKLLGTPNSDKVIWIRLLIIAVGVMLCFPRFFRKHFKVEWFYLFHLALFLVVNISIPWGRLNNHTPVLIGISISAALIYFALADWRLSLSGTILGTAFVIAIYLLRTGDEYEDLSPLLQYGRDYGIAMVGGLLLAFREVTNKRTRVKATSLMVGVMAHELRTPVASIGMATQYIKENCRPQECPHSPRITEVILNAQESVKQMNAIIDMQLANAQLINIHNNREKVQLDEVVMSLGKLYPFKSKADAASLKIVIHDKVTVLASNQLLYQVIVNLLKNALTAVAKAGKVPVFGDVTIELSRRGSNAQLIVRDHGCGIPQKDLRRVFEPFYSTSPDASHGLGLPFVRQMVKEADGTIEIASSPEQGTEFIIELPLFTAK